MISRGNRPTVTIDQKKIAARPATLHMIVSAAILQIVTTGTTGIKPRFLNNASAALNLQT